MKKKRIKNITVSILLFLAFLLSSCHSAKFGSNVPTNFVGSIWKSENDIVFFQVDDNHRATGIMQTPNGPLEIFILMYGSSEFSIYPIELMNNSSIPNGSMIEDWGADFYSKEEFNVYIRHSTYFTEGDIIHFFRISEIDDDSLPHGENPDCT